MINPIYAFIIPTAMASVGVGLQMKDTNKTGLDDSLGSILVAGAPAVAAALDGSNGGPAAKKAMTAIRDSAQAWLDANP